ncbi:hypothetical protein [Nesterenkonia alba]|uniref:hypothetical protein n=1 Tax=Nesterenkonia alba TaxID=515814 RepID=UPI0003B52C7B|nr:hypothetical protein [Nesterenkonia alba]
MTTRTIVLSRAAEQYIRTEINRLEGIYPAPVNHDFVVQRLQEVKLHLEFLLTMNSDLLELILGTEEAENFRRARVAPLVAEKTEAERLLQPRWGDKDRARRHHAAAHLLMHSPYYPEVARVLVHTDLDDPDHTDFAIPGNLAEGELRIAPPEGMSADGRRVAMLVFHLLGFVDDFDSALGKLLPGLDPQTSFAFYEACQILQS